MQSETFTHNSKTILSLDFNRQATCGQICDYCYVETTERIRPAYAVKIKKNSTWAKENPETLATQLNLEYRKHRNSKAKVYKRLPYLPVRIYGAGDFIPEHLRMFKKYDFKFYLISKKLTKANYFIYVEELLTIPNLTKIILSFDNQNIFNYQAAKQLYFGRNKIGFAFTGLADDFVALKDQGLKFNIFFNIKKTNVEKLKSQAIKEACPCDSGKQALAESCSRCNKCWRSSVTKGKTWNSYQ